MELHCIFRLSILKMARIAIKRCIITIDITQVMKKQRDQHVEEQNDTETKMRLKGHCMCLQC